jgi:hypothetical protein
MSLKKFREEFGGSLEAATRGAMGTLTGNKMKSSTKAANKSDRREAIRPVKSSSNTTTASTTASSICQGDNNENTLSCNVNNNDVYASATKTTSSQSRIFQTPSHGTYDGAIIAQTPGSVRPPRDGEMMLSQNGSPLGEYQRTVVKANRGETQSLEEEQQKLIDSANSNANHVPQTPIASGHPNTMTLKTGQVMDMDMSSVDLAALPDDAKADALLQMQQMMASMQAMMAKLGGTLAAATKQHNGSMDDR